MRKSMNSSLADKIFLVLLPLQALIFCSLCTFAFIVIPICCLSNKVCCVQGPGTETQTQVTTEVEIQDMVSLTVHG